MSIDATNWAWSLQNITSCEKLILLSYADRAGESMEAWPSKRRLELDTCLSHNSIDKALKSLSKKGYIVKTGEVRNQVPVYRLIGVPKREDRYQNLSTTPPKSGTPTPPKYGVQNHKKNPQKNPKAERPSFSSFSSLSLFLNYIEKLLEIESFPVTKELVDQINFYAQKSKGKRDPVESVHIAINLLKKKQWNIPNGWQGITNKSIKEKEEAAQKAKEEGFKEDKVVMAGIKKGIETFTRTPDWAEMCKGLGANIANNSRVPENNVSVRL